MAYSARWTPEMATAMLSAAIQAVEKYRQTKAAHPLESTAAEQMFATCYPEREKLITDISGESEWGESE